MFMAASFIRQHVRKAFNCRVIVTNERCVVASGSFLSFSGDVIPSSRGLELNRLFLLFGFRLNCKIIIMVSAVGSITQVFRG